MLLLLVAHAPGAAALRIISLAPSVTETVFALGAGEQVVGVSVYCDYPPEVSRLDRVGTFLSPNVESIVAKRPDVVIVVPSPGNHTPVETLRRLGITVLVVDPASVQEIKDSILQIGKALGRDAQAQQLIGAIEARLEKTRRRLAAAPPRKVLMVVGQTPLIAAGRGTMQDELITMANGINIGAKAGGSWPHISIEFALTEAPEVIIDTTMGNEERPGASAAVEFWSAFPTLPAVRARRIYGFREYQLLRPGPRVAEAFESIARFVHPELMR